MAIGESVIFKCDDRVGDIHRGQFVTAAEGITADRFHLIAQRECRHLEAPVEGICPDFGHAVAYFGLLQCFTLIKSIIPNGLYRLGDGDIFQTAFAEG